MSAYTEMAPRMFRVPLLGLKKKERIALDTQTVAYDVIHQAGAGESDQTWRKVEKEDLVLIETGILPMLIKRAMRELPSVNWEKELNEL
ncbi:MAG TPA: hypothetical protein PKE45_04585 [Caldilineaceae bacterium]|nr:hypothetical protein [Caldilineaceae bacterium]